MVEEQYHNFVSLTLSHRMRCSNIWWHELIVWIFCDTAHWSICKMFQQALKQPEIVVGKTILLALHGKRILFLNTPFRCSLDNDEADHYLQFRARAHTHTLTKHTLQVKSFVSVLTVTLSDWRDCWAHQPLISPCVIIHLELQVIIRIVRAKCACVFTTPHIPNIPHVWPEAPLPVIKSSESRREGG